MKPVRQRLLFSKTSRGCGLVTLALALAWVARGTDLTTGTWQPVGTQPAPGDSASQTDNAAGGDQRYYRVCYRP